jgi:anti-sigma regulatory factor (Ser/Thr protein kinase)
VPQPRTPAVASLELDVEATPSSLAVLRTVSAAFARSIGVGEESVEAVAVAVNEAASNSLVHGYRENEGGMLRLVASLAGSALVITLSDDGVGDQAGAREGDEVGRGFLLMRALASGVDVSRGERGTRVRLTFPLKLKRAGDLRHQTLS